MKFKNTLAVAVAVAATGVVMQNRSASANAVNDYIYSRNYTPSESQNNIQQWLNNPNWEGVNMSYRHGKPEGVLGRCCQDYGQVFSTPQGAATPKNFQNPDFSLKWRDFWVFL